MYCVKNMRCDQNVLSVSDVKEKKLWLHKNIISKPQPFEVSVLCATGLSSSGHELILVFVTMFILMFTFRHHLSRQQTWKPAPKSCTGHWVFHHEMDAWQQCSSAPTQLLFPHPTTGCLCLRISVFSHFPSMRLWRVVIWLSWKKIYFELQIDCWKHLDNSSSTVYSKDNKRAVSGVALPKIAT